jgi:putative redox protein
VVTIGAPFVLAHVRHRIDPDRSRRPKTDGEAEIHPGGRASVVRQNWLAVCVSTICLCARRGAAAALPLMHAPDDDTGGIDDATHFFTAAHHPKSPKSVVSLDDADRL